MGIDQVIAGWVVRTIGRVCSYPVIGQQIPIIEYTRPGMQTRRLSRHQGQDRESIAAVSKM